MWISVLLSKLPPCLEGHFVFSLQRNYGLIFETEYTGWIRMCERPRRSQKTHFKCVHLWQWKKTSAVVLLVAVAKMKAPFIRKLSTASISNDGRRRSISLQRDQYYFYQNYFTHLYCIAAWAISGCFLNPDKIRKSKVEPISFQLVMLSRCLLLYNIK